MSLNLPAHISLPTSPGRLNTAIAELVFWGHVWPLALLIRIVQEWHYWSHRRERNIARCIVYGWWRNLIVLLAQIRIVGFALYLATKDPTRSLVITEVVLQGVGVSPLILEMSLVLLKCGHAGLKDRRATQYPPLVKTLLNWTRLPIFAAIILICVAGGIVNTTLIKAGAIVLVVAFAYLVFILAYLLLSGHYSKLPKNAQHGVLLVVAALPFYVVRIVYMLLGDFRGVRFSPAIGDWKLMVGLEFVMEICIVLLLIGSTLVVEPILGRRAGDVEDEDAIENFAKYEARI